MNIYISNLDNDIKDQDLKELFQSFGEVTAARIETDVFTGVSRGFGYVEMTDEASATKAINELDQSTVRGLIVSVSPALSKPLHRGSYKVGSSSIKTYKFKRN